MRESRSVNIEEYYAGDDGLNIGTSITLSMNELTSGRSIMLSMKELLSIGRAPSVFVHSCIIGRSPRAVVHELSIARASGALVQLSTIGRDIDGIVRRIGLSVGAAASEFLRYGVFGRLTFWWRLDLQL